jgi:glycosyltransferase involved in cell wall biosynthesis
VRICMLNDNFYRGSGITLALQRLLRTPAFAEMEVFLAGAETLEGRASTQEDTGMVPSGHYRCFPLMTAGAKLLPALLRFASWVRSMRFDVLHVHHRRLAVLANLSRPLHGTPVLFTGHLTFSDAGWFRQFAPADATGVSPSVVAYLRRCTKAERVSLIYNAVEFPERTANTATFGSAKALSVGRLEPIKGHRTLVDAWGRLRDRGVKAQLDIYGEGSLRGELMAQIADLGLQDVVRLRGFVPDIRELLPQYAFNVLASEKEGFPNVVVEAAAYGLPTLLTDVDGSRDAVPPGLTLPNRVMYGDVTALCEALAMWLGSPTQVEADGRRFTDHLRPKCAPEVVGRQFAEVYAGLRERRGLGLRRGFSNMECGE